MPETLYHDLTIAGPVEAVQAALRRYRAEPNLSVPAPWLPPVLVVTDINTGTEAGQPVLRVGLRTTEAIPVPDGCWISDAKMTLGSVGLWAALDPVPSSVTKRQFFRQLRDDGVISQAEAVAAAGRGEIPQTLATRMGEAPAALVADIELDLASMQVVERGSQTWQVVAGLLGWDDTVQDSFFTRAARL